MVGRPETRSLIVFNPKSYFILIFEFLADPETSQRTEPNHMRETYKS